MLLSQDCELWLLEVCVVDEIRAKVIIAGLCLKNVEQIVGRNLCEKAGWFKEEMCLPCQAYALPQQPNTNIYSMYTQLTQ